MPGSLALLKDLVLEVFAPPEQRRSLVSPGSIQTKEHVGCRFQVFCFSIDSGMITDGMSELRINSDRKIFVLECIKLIRRLLYGSNCNYPRGGISSRDNR